MEEVLKAGQVVLPAKDTQDCAIVAAASATDGLGDQLVIFGQRYPDAHRPLNGEREHPDVQRRE